MQASPRRVQYVIHWGASVVNSEVSRIFAAQLYKQLREQGSGSKSHNYRSAFLAAKLDIAQLVDESTHNLLCQPDELPVVDLGREAELPKRVAKRLDQLT